MLTRRIFTSTQTMAFSCPLKARLSVPDLASNILAIASPLPVYTAKEKKYI